MEYRWGNYCLDRKGSLLTCRGQQVDTSRKVLDCISHLVEHRERVVGYGELIRKVWGHDNATNNQLSHVIVTARRALGDNGHAQRLIRTVPGLGYRWIGMLCEGPAESPGLLQTGASVQFSDATPVVASPDAVEPMAAMYLRRAAASAEARTVATGGNRGITLRAACLLALVLIGVAGIGGQFHKSASRAVVAQPAVPPSANPLAQLEEAFAQGQFETVREGLATLQADLADSPEARILEIQLDIARGRFDRAAQKLAQQQARADRAADAVWRAKLLTLQSVLGANNARPEAEALPPARVAISLLESAGTTVPVRTMGEALSARGNGFLIDGQLDLAMQDLVRAADILLKAGDTRGATVAKRFLAHTWLRMGRLPDALEEINEVADTTARLVDPVNEISSRNIATKILIEELRWDQALTSSERTLRVAETVPDSTRRAPSMQLHVLLLTSIGRLREAGSLQEEVDAIRGRPKASTHIAIYHLASGRPQQAIAEAAKAFAQYDETSKPYLVLDNRDGALLVWMIAAQALAANGHAMPEPSSVQLAALQKPESTIGRIARGRWLWSQGQMRAAETELRQALKQAREQNRLRHMLLACEPLVELLLRRGDTVTGAQLLRDLEAQHPERLAQDYDANLLALRVALAEGDNAATTAAYRDISALAGERTLPLDVMKAYAQARPQAGKPNLTDTAFLAP